MARVNGSASMLIVFCGISWWASGFRFMASFIGRRGSSEQPDEESCSWPGSGSSAVSLVRELRSKLCARSLYLWRTCEKYSLIGVRCSAQPGGGQRPAGLDTTHFSAAPGYLRRRHECALQPQIGR